MLFTELVELVLFHYVLELLIEGTARIALNLVCSNPEGTALLFVAFADSHRGFSSEKALIVVAMHYTSSSVGIEVSSVAKMSTFSMGCWSHLSSWTQSSRIMSEIMRKYTTSDFITI